jgi:hypothetical protein
MTMPVSDPPARITLPPVAKPSSDAVFGLIDAHERLVAAATDRA